MEQKTITAVHTIIDRKKNYIAEISPAAVKTMYNVTYTTDVNSALDFFSIPNAEKNVRHFVNHHSRAFFIEQESVSIKPSTYINDLK
ncbi:hypothetical protein QEG73_21820 [Chitinophagaceae bacterium 26-R-25]|nr:hypothetical protein [Chitinophagaceae bacterium 26-R-25]